VLSLTITASLLQHFPEAWKIDINMHFERSLKRTIYAPWRDQYIDYPKLKDLLRDNGSDDGSADEGDQWTDEDEGKFVEELVNVQLEKVANFQSSTLQNLRERAADCEAKLEPIVNKSKEEGSNNEDEPSKVQLDEETKKTLQDVLKELDGITEEMNELEKYSRINYTGFLKATKKHDRRRGASYRVRPLMQVRLAALPFNKEDYSPLLFRLSTMYSFARQQLEEGKSRQSFSDSQSGGMDKGYTTHKCELSRLLYFTSANTFNQSGYTLKTSSSSRRSFSDVFRSSSTTRTHPRLPRDIRKTLQSPPSTLTTPNSPCTMVRSTTNRTPLLYVCDGTISYLLHQRCI